MVDMARERILESTAAERRSTNRRKIEQRVAEKVCIASKFDWTWTFDNIRQFCDMVGWHEDPDAGHSIEHGGDLTTDIDVRQPGASLSVGQGDIRYCSFKAVDTLFARNADDGMAAERIVKEFNSLAGVIESRIGRPLCRPADMNENSEMAWILPKVVVRLRRSVQGVRVWMINPRYLTELDGNLER
ncbi:DUF6301 family protein [Nocardia sp. NPDC060220]|uniref:DUF6301 family protein n=1 Tax=Nocardia sp. NPDC060220 TaxID=3347076 RepID=UPI003654AEE2